MSTLHEQAQARARTRAAEETAIEVASLAREAAEKAINDDLEQERNSVFQISLPFVVTLFRDQLQRGMLFQVGSFYLELEGTRNRISTGIENQFLKSLVYEGVHEGSDGITDDVSYLAVLIKRFKLCIPEILNEYKTSDPDIKRLNYLHAYIYVDFTFGKNHELLFATSANKSCHAFRPYSEEQVITEISNELLPYFLEEYYYLLETGKLKNPKKWWQIW